MDEELIRELVDQEPKGITFTKQQKWTLQMLTKGQPKGLIA